jgi:hypothetical protein
VKSEKKRQKEKKDTPTHIRTKKEHQQRKKNRQTEKKRAL